MNELLKDKHAKYILTLDFTPDTVEYWMTEHLRLNGIYWGTTALVVLDRLSDIDEPKIIAQTLECLNKDGGFGAAAGHDSHLLFTLSAIQILTTFGSLDRIDASKAEQCIVT